ncbi:hypothetical protein EOPP23_05020 [Endozoicomonas sp. OPT23]|uniref:PP2C family serine/threonine-protein phosphatase n=1 Tax=Endozoicomonas sp. OPT23 TaxID=2072845 RepID=UPI00129AB957|nr:PP2C family protein-serine/threonine phosphatase [Endozoicomonas sp. OPT23]MRI32343.1 hypothetical protein [Endozoicomonas sp. OPT23]
MDGNPGIYGGVKTTKESAFRKEKQQVEEELEGLKHSKSSLNKLVRLENGQLKLGPKSKKTVWGLKFVRVILGDIKPVMKRLDAIQKLEQQQAADAVKKLRKVKVLPRETPVEQGLTLKESLEAVKSSASVHTVPKGDRVRAPYMNPESRYFKQSKKAPDLKQLQLIEDREYRLVPSPRDVERKLDSEFLACKEQQKRQGEDTVFSGKQATSDGFDDGVQEGSKKLTLTWPVKNRPGETFDGSYDLKYTTVEGTDSGICSTQGLQVQYENQDRSLATTFDINVAGRKQVVSLTGVFDGHGRSDAADYAKAHIAEKLQARLNEYGSKELTDTVIWNAIKVAFVDLNHSFLHDSSDREASAGTTINVALKIGNQLWVGNLGDSRAMILTESGKSIQLSEDADLEDAKYQQGVEVRGGQVTDLQWSGKTFKRVNNTLGTARSMGEHNQMGAVSGRPKITKIKLEQGMSLVQVSDGITQKAKTEDIGSEVHRSLKEGQTTAQAATNVVERALRTQSVDHLTAVVTKF